MTEKGKEAAPWEERLQKATRTVTSSSGRNWGFPEKKPASFWKPPERIEKIESGKSLPHPDEVLTMAAKYRRPSLCNYYCSNQCPIGQAYVPEIEMKELSAIVLEMLASLNCVNREKERLIEITADGKIEGEEIDDFIRIQEELEKISVTVEALQLWAEKMLANGIIDPEAYRARKQK